MTATAEFLMPWESHDLATRARSFSIERRIGELYAAMITNGQMATAVNQQGYDVVSGHGEHISVKTTAMMIQTRGLQPSVPQ